MATSQVQQINTPLPREIFATVASPTPPTQTRKQWDLSPPPPPEPKEPRPRSIYERVADAEEREEPFGQRSSRSKFVAQDHSNAEELELMPESWRGPTLLFLILVPLVICILLVLIKPGFVTDLSSDGQMKILKIDKVILWTLIISVVVWVLIYGFNLCRCNLK